MSRLELALEIVRLAELLQSAELAALADCADDGDRLDCVDIARDIARTLACHNVTVCHDRATVVNKGSRSKTNRVAFFRKSDNRDNGWSDSIEDLFRS